MPTYDQPVLMPAGDLAIVVEYGDASEIRRRAEGVVPRQLFYNSDGGHVHRRRGCEAVAAIEHLLAIWVTSTAWSGRDEVVPTYRSALAYLDSQTGMVHSVCTTSANVHDVTQAHRLRRHISGVEGLVSGLRRNRRYPTHRGDTDTAVAGGDYGPDSIGVPDPS